MLPPNVAALADSLAKVGLDVLPYAKYAVLGYLVIFGFVVLFIFGSFVFILRQFWKMRNQF